MTLRFGRTHIYIYICIRNNDILPCLPYVSLTFYFVLFINFTDLNNTNCNINDKKTGTEEKSVIASGLKSKYCCSSGETPRKKCSNANEALGKGSIIFNNECL